MTKPKKGAVVLVLFPNSDLVTAKRRPALVVQSDEPVTGLKQVIVAMITSNLTRMGHPSRVRIDKNSDEGKSAGLLTDSVIMTDNLATVRYMEMRYCQMLLMDQAATRSDDVKSIPSVNFTPCHNFLA